MKKWLSFFISTLVSLFLVVTVFAKEVTLLGPETFLQETSAPITKTMEFSVPNAGKATIRVINGLEDSTDERVSSAAIALNNALAFGPNSFNQDVTLLEKTVSLLKGKNRLSVGLFSKSKGRISVSITAPAAISLDQGLDAITVEAGSNRYTAMAINFLKDNGNTYHITFSQSITPDNGGVHLFNDYPSGGWSSTTPQTFIVNEYIDALTAGIYTITSTATVVETGETDSKSFVLEIVEVGGGEKLSLVSPSTEPDGISINTPTEVVFTSLATGTNNPPPTLTLEEVDENGTVLATLGVLKDDGTGGDLIANDFVYSGTFTITGTTEGKKFYRTTGSHNGEVITSEVDFLAVTRFPVGTVPSNPDSLVEDSKTGELMYSDELTVAFLEGVSPDRIEEIVAAEGATMVGTIPSLGIFQLHLVGNGTAEFVWSVVEAFNTYPEVDYVEPSFQTTPSATFPNDPKFSVQKNMTVIRADETWLITKGKVAIAIVDTGVDYNHNDLKNKVIKGRDFISGDNNPMDEHSGSHGTHVAGIAAAETNNNIGVTGVAWDSKILAIRGIGGSYLTLAKAILYAANRVKIINVSGGGYYNSKVVHLATKYAVNTKKRLLVVAAGNDKSETRFYPCAYNESLCVGNSTDIDGRASSSTYGNWVDIAAPGENIMSTIKNNNYGSLSGTSMATPLVSGAAAVIWSMHPSWTAAQVRERLLKTAKPLPDNLKIGNRLDLFEAVFNGSFEIGDLSEWKATGTCSSFQQLGPLSPKHLKRMGYCSTGPAGDEVAASLTKTFIIQPDVTNLPIKFEYNFVTEEYPEWVGTQYNDALKVILTAPDGSKTTLATETVNGSSFSLIGGIDFPGGDNTVGETGWKTASATIPVTSGNGTYQIEITDAGDDIYDSVILIDNIRLK